MPLAAGPQRATPIRWSSRPALAIQAITGLALAASMTLVAAPEAGATRLLEDDAKVPDVPAREIQHPGVPPYPRSTVIGNLEWHWETHVTAAPGSDLWPVAWGPDDQLYAAWGDGGGFGGADADGRVALGFARIEGGPEHWSGVNVNGGNGPKQSAGRRGDNRLYLARGSRKKLRERAGYEFFQGVDALGTPAWGREDTLAQPVFADPNGVTPASVVYHPGLKRFLLTCFHVGPGQLGVFDAPHPWGPWTTVAYDEHWGQMGTDGEGLTCGFPQKWISADGLTLCSIFSVYGEGAKQGVNAHDKFNVAQATLRLRPQASGEPYYPPPESAGGWRTLTDPEDVRRMADADPVKLAELKAWLWKSDDRDFAAVVIRRGYIVLEVERGNSAKTDSRRVASVSKAICATVLAIASEASQHGLTPRRMTFQDRAFDFIPWAQPLSDPRKATITVQQLLNHTSGLCPEATGAPNDGTWDYILGHTGDARTATLAFDPGAACGYSTHALAHAALVCEAVTGMPYDQYAVQALFQPLGIEHWWFQFYEGGEKYGRHPSHGLGMPARDLARIAYCMLRDGRWKDRQVVPQWFVGQTAAPTHDVKTPELRWKLNPQVFSHGWELPARHWAGAGRNAEGIPADARSKPGSGGQLIAFVPSLDLVVVRQTGSSGEWEYEEYLRRACAAVPSPEP
jgi:CubicO group peptidase (beta-lactamase class C family)